MLARACKTTLLLAIANCIHLGFVQSAQAELPQVGEEKHESSTRIRVSLVGYRFSISDISVMGSGPELAIEKPLSERWMVSGSIGQAYSFGENIQTLFTSLDAGVQYSLWGSYIQERRIWRDESGIIGEYVGKKTGGLRIGLATQQYLFNTESATLPFSGVGAKILYEVGLNWFIDLAIGAEVSRLMNPNYTINSMRGFLSVVMPL